MDLNLLVCLQVILEERSVTRAANRLHLTQSAVSKSLARLRKIFDDPLFVRSPEGLQPTPHLLSVSGSLEHILRQVSDITVPSSFDHLNSDRRFSLVMVNSAYQTMMRSFLQPMLKEARGLTFDLSTWDETSMKRLLQGEYDLAIACRDLHPDSEFQLEHLPSQLDYQLLYKDTHVCILNEKHPALELEWSLETFLSLGHVQARCEGKDWWALDYRLAESGHQRNIRVTAPDFADAINICAQTDLVFTAPGYYAHLMCQQLPLTVRTLPVALGEFAHIMLWRKISENDSSQNWLREQIGQRVAHHFQS